MPGVGGFGHGCGPRGQRGAATLVVVMILFFIISMVAAYTNRSLIFEQRTSANQARSTRAFEAAQAGLEWALSMLNSGRTTAACTLSANAADTGFRQRYLVIDPATGAITPKKRSDGVTDLYPTCVYNGVTWACNCPTDAAPAVAAPVGSDVYPAFRVRFRRMCAAHTAPDTACVTPMQPGVIYVDINGCTSLSESCLSFTAAAPQDGEGRATLHVMAALQGALPGAPTAALTVRGGVNIGAASLGVFNIDPATPGYTLHTGSALVPFPTNARLHGHPGRPGPLTVRDNDNALAALSADRMFTNVFGMARQTYLEQPATVYVDCSAVCNAATVRNKADMNPGRILWLDGNVNLDSLGDIGSLSQPVMLNVTGNLSFSAAVNVYGMVYSQAATWTSSGAGQIQGAAVAEGSFAGTATTDIVYDAVVLKRLRTLTGSFVLVPGSWRDFDS